MPTQEQRNIVMLASTAGMIESRIAEMIINPETSKPITPKRLREHFRHEIDNGRELILMKIAGTMVSVATDKAHKGCVTAGIYLTKVWGRWREPEPEWAERRRAEEEGRQRAGEGWTIIDARPVLEEPKPDQAALPGPTTLQ